MPPMSEEVPPVPPMPAMAAAPHALSPVATQSPVHPLHASLAVESWEAHAVPGVSAESFAVENFDPSSFVSQQVQQQSEAGLQNLRATLGQIQTTTQKQLKEQVFQNYAEFITISREIATFENDMLEFKELLSEWKALPHQLQIEDPLGEGMWDNEPSLRAIRKGHRVSSIDLEQIYKAQLTSLWENIEGSQKFVPIVPGRHLIAETSQFVEVNAATYKPKQAVALFLLDDLLLISVQRKRPYGSRVHLVAERCFNLSEIVVVDLKDTKDVRNALKIKHGKESFVYRSERSQDKRALLRAFRGVGEALAARLKKERKQRAAKRNEEGMLGDSMDPTSQDLGLADKAAAPAPSQDDLAALGPWLNSVIDALAVHIALREWEEAVALVEEGKQRLASRPVSEGSLYLLVEKFNGCASDLVRAISAELVSPYQRKSMVVRNAGLLVRLDKGREARDLLLEARTALLQRRMRQIKYEGDVSLYISELAMLYFTLIKNTGDWYMAAFKDYKMASGMFYSFTQALCSGPRTRCAPMPIRSGGRSLASTRTPAWCKRPSILREAVHRSSTMWDWVWDSCSSTLIPLMQRLAQAGRRHDSAPCAARHADVGLGSTAGEPRAAAVRVAQCATRVDSYTAVSRRCRRRALSRLCFVLSSVSMVLCTRWFFLSKPLIEPRMNDLVSSSSSSSSLRDLRFTG